VGNNKDLTELTFHRLLSEFSARTPTPGGGAAAGLVAALGAALGAMAFRFSRKKDDVESELETLAETLQEEAVRLSLAAEEDCRAYEEVRSAFRLPRETEEEKAARKEAVRRATLGAMASPLSLLENILGVARTLQENAGRVKAALASDLASAAWCLRTGGEAAWLNVRINAASLGEEDPQGREALEKGSALRESLLESLEGVLAEAERNL